VVRSKETKGTLVYPSENTSAPWPAGALAKEAARRLTPVALFYFSL